MAALRLGLRNFSARTKGESSQPLTQPYGKDPAVTTTRILGGHPVYLTSGTQGGNQVQRATYSSALGAAVTNAAILGLAAQPEQAATTAAYADFGLAFPPAQKLSDQGVAGVEQMQVYVGDSDTIFTASLISGLAATQSLVGQDAGFSVDDLTENILAINPSQAAGWDLVTIIGINPSDVNKVGGRVDFIIRANKSQYPPQSS